MTESEADDILADAELVPALEGSLRDIKRMRGQCLDADIPVGLMAPPGKG